MSARERSQARAASRRQAPAPIRVLVVDDAESSRRAICALLEDSPEVEVVGRAGDGDEALRETLRLRPDVICLDLQMPRMDGFTFMRLMMARQPTPVIVVSSQSRKADVFRALELGALDFIPKPQGRDDRLEAIREELMAKIRTVRFLRLENLEVRAAAAEQAVPVAVAPEPPRVAVIGASTGGPPALERLVAALPANVPLALVAVQHMPERFTRAFAERISRRTAFSVSEAGDCDLVAAGRMLLAPGGKHLRLERADSRPELRVRLVSAAGAGRRYCPSIDLLFESAAAALGDRVCGVVLTGMGNDGRAGTEAIKARGGLTLAESQETAVVYGMPKEAVATGRVDEVLALDRIAERLIRFAEGR